MDSNRNRSIGRIRTWNNAFYCWRPWCTIPEQAEQGTPQNVSYSQASQVNNTKIIKIKLRRGSVLKFFPGIISPSDLPPLQKAMEKCQLYRQYERKKGIKEPRVHVLLSSTARMQPNMGYRYHSIKMIPEPLDLVPGFEVLSEKYAKLMSLPNDTWNIGVDLIVYRDGNDSMGFHSDDNQGETSVLAVVVECEDSRPVHIKPHDKIAKQEGDEQVQLFVRQGDAYELDAGCQAGYEHSLPKKEKSHKRRMVAIFKQGDQRFLAKDSGVSVKTSATSSPTTNQYPWVKNLQGEFFDCLKPAQKRSPVTFGHISPFAEGSISLRMNLYNARLCSDQRGVNGNVKLGADALVFSRNDPNLRETDGFTWVRYTSKRSEGGASMAKSYLDGSPIRVLRSSNLKASLFAPIKKNKEAISAVYRYDGLYTIILMIDNEGKVTISPPGPKSGEHVPEFTFFLQRNPTRQEVFDFEFKENQPFQLGEFGFFSSLVPEFCNAKSDIQLWTEIQTTNGVKKSELQEIPSVPCPAISSLLDLKKLRNYRETTEKLYLAPISMLIANNVEITAKTFISSFKVCVKAAGESEALVLAAREVHMTHFEQAATSAVDSELIRFNPAFLNAESVSELRAVMNVCFREVKNWSKAGPCVVKALVKGAEKITKKGRYERE
ncbi:hypothetical protein TL16_g13072 [Triparma laevis f. inornata]|uniref:Alpha-ketoglutarate-dependent dioxygenase AlkB-like domain-containing protein n=2 Tax=Triparma laevis TaxID=1534972 RepID=A0A9W7E9N4_9STRA|nr:hypothetical protein TrLO_g14715 [Triparma laevis f. longispina]GMH95073.1 hypothetical protein TL16_g13072 [Triparma laevis f. inornata]